MSAPAGERLVLLGYVAGAHGVGGALRVKLYNAESSTLTPGMKLWLRAGDGDSDNEGEGEARVLARIAPKPGSDMVRLWLEGIDGRDDAEALRGRELLIDRAALPEPEADEYYLGDLIG
ncbi:MAG: hypothetical protein KC431_21370, partial [Myxococcales bacterium]|nr:hypothetical protein [Myxococcales bacterium]